jgi:peptidoglycan/LPS O-acetylase OafA/YrhL
MQKEKISKILRWIARIWSILVLLFLVVMFAGSILFPEDGSGEWQTVEIIAAFFFPIGVMVGLIYAWKNELLGGLATVASFIIFSILILIPRGALFRGGPVFLLVTMPGVLFVITGLLSRKK